MPKKSVTLRVDATLDLDLRDFKQIDAMALEELASCIFEIMESTAPISIRCGTKAIRGKVRLTTPTPYELKVARLEFLDKK